MPDDGVCWIPAPPPDVLLITRAGVQLLHIDTAASKENPDLSRGSFLIVSAHPKARTWWSRSWVSLGLIEYPTCSKAYRKTPVGTRNVGTGSQGRRDDVVLRVIAVPGLTTVVAGSDIVRSSDHFLTLFVSQIYQQLFILHVISPSQGQLPL